MSVRLTPIQQRVVDHGDGALLVEAGPGSGKTRVLTERVRRLLADSSGHFRVLALTFTNKAANEMVERLDDVPEIRKRAFIGTLHSFCMEVLANRGKHVGVDSLPNIFDSFEDRKHVLADAVRADPYLSTLLKASGDTKQQQATLSRWLGRISELKNSLVIPSMVEDGDERMIYEGYDSGLRASAALDYDDLLLLTYRLFEERPKIAEFYQRQYRYICIDEAQDWNEAQYRLLVSLCGDTFRNVMAVGDPRQAIYVWNGADPKYLDLFAERFSATRLSLNENFRSSRTVVHAAQRLDATYVVEGQLPVVGEVNIAACENESAEADAVLAKLNELIEDGHPDVEGVISLGRCAVLARNRFVFKSLEVALNDAGFDYYLATPGGAYRSESNLVEEFELALRVLSNPRDQLHKAVLTKAWGIPVPASDHSRTPSSLQPLSQLEQLATLATKGCAEAVWKAICAMKWSELNVHLTRSLDCLVSSAAVMPDEERALVLDDVAEWRKNWDFYVRSEAGGNHTLTSFLGQMALGTTQQPKQNGLALLTVHAAKGMEFDVVFLIGMAEGTFPDYRAHGAALDEERRSAFVAVTRSKRLLYVLYPKLRTMPWGDQKYQQPSRFIAEMA